MSQVTSIISVPVNIEEDEIELKPTKASLKELHQNYVSNFGASSKEQQNAMIAILGGFDHILSMILESNAIINDKQLQNLHDILSNPQKFTQHKNNNNKIINNKNRIEDRGYGQTITLNFFNKDVLLYSIFNKHTASKIINILNCNIMRFIITICMFMIGIISMISSFTQESNITQKSLQIIRESQGIISIFKFILSIYLFGILLLANKEAMKLIFKEFVFYFKMLYLIVYIVSISIARYWIEGYLIHHIFTSAAFQSAFLILTILIDAYVEYGQKSKIAVSTIALATFSNNALYYIQTSLEGIELNVSIFPKNVELESMTFDIVSMAINSSQILAIFSLQQLISSIFSPNKGTLIKIKPIIISDKKRETELSKKMIRMRRLTCIAYWIITIGLLVLISPNYELFSERYTERLLVCYWVVDSCSHCILTLFECSQIFVHCHHFCNFDCRHFWNFFVFMESTIYCFFLYWFWNFCGLHIANKASNAT